jgi:N-acetylneuraminic acid mutarotase
MRLAIRLSALRLPTPTTRAVAFASASGLVVVGGLTPGGTTSRVIHVPIDGRAAFSAGRLVHPVHDAAGADLHGSMLVLGGGASTQQPWVQRVGIDGPSVVTGWLPVARADLGAVVAGSQLIVVGGGALGRADPRVLATTDGVRFRVVATLPVPVRYAAVAVAGSTILVLGGTSSAGDTAVIQAVDLGRGTAAVVGRLPQAMSHATALVVDGVLLVAGGRHGGRALDGVLEIDPTSFAARVAGRLPQAESDAAGVVMDGVAYLVGGEAAAPLTTVVTIQVVE